MIREITLGEVAVKFKASAATNILYKRAFREDITVQLTEYAQKANELKKLQAEIASTRSADLTDEEKLEKIQELMKNKAVVDASAFGTETLPKLAYIMYLEGNVTVDKIFGQLTEEAYLTWLMDHDMSEIADNLHDFLDIWTKGAKTTSKAKN